MIREEGRGAFVALRNFFRVEAIRPTDRAFLRMAAFLPARTGSVFLDGEAVAKHAGLEPILGIKNYNSLHYIHTRVGAGNQWEINGTTEDIHGFDIS